MGWNRLPALCFISVALATTACGSGAVSTPTPRPSPVPGFDWVAGDGAHLEPHLRGRSDIAFFGGYEAEDWKTTWGVETMQQAETCSITADPAIAYQGKSLRARYPVGSHGGDLTNKGGCQYYARFARLGLGAFDELHLRYYVRFDPGFNFVKGGKLPGLAGGTSNSGGNIPNGTDGFSVRLMWRGGGRVVIYAYLPTSVTWGTDFPWDYRGEWRSLRPGRWTSLEIRVRLNTPGAHDGEIDCWFDGERACEVRNLRFRDVSTLKIDNIFFSTFFGGNTPDWAPTKDEHATFDNFVLARGYIGP